MTIEDELEIASVPELLRLYDAVLRQLTSRGVLRSTNNPIADYAEWLVAGALGLQLAGKSAAGFDAVGPEPERLRYQVKARRPTPQNPSRQLSFMHGLDRDPFDVLVGVLFTPTLEVHRVAAIPIDLVRAHAAYVAHVNAWRFILRDSVWDWPEVTDLTDVVRSHASTPLPAQPSVIHRVEPRPVQAVVSAAAKTCRACGEVFPATQDYFYAWRRGGELIGDGWYPDHKACYRRAREARARQRSTQS